MADALCCVGDIAGEKKAVCLICSAIFNAVFANVSYLPAAPEHWSSDSQFHAVEEKERKNVSGTAQILHDDSCHCTTPNTIQ